MMDAVGLRGREGAVRLSLLHYNDESDVDAVLAALGSFRSNPSVPRDISLIKGD